MAPEWQRSGAFRTDWAPPVAKRTSTDAAVTDARSERARVREIKGEKRHREGESGWISEHIAHYSPRQGCEILSQSEAEAVAARGVVGGRSVHVYVCMCTYGGSDSGLSLGLFSTEHNNNRQRKIEREEEEVRRCQQSAHGGELKARQAPERRRRQRIRSPSVKRYA